MQDVNELLRFISDLLKQKNPVARLAEFFEERLEDPRPAIRMASYIVEALKRTSKKASACRSEAARYQVWTMALTSRINAPVIRPLIAAANRIDQQKYSQTHWRTEWNDEHDDLYANKASAKKAPSIFD